ncbi:MAG: GHKL domain-containing protein [Gammaproteobacteria bacterium]|nr:GHKL domain-containing protein [Gammaproteobacteria bacterium]MBU1731126.1 GHKL domain-containing protein [Gammaproteobacteria bacterium]MBU1891437.1 GHKL domain-containing protein [Gammaproteobacteria bacterium]
MSDHLPVPSFDREMGFAELLADIPRERLQKALVLLLGGAFRLVDATGNVLIGASIASEQARRMPVVLELEPVGYLECVNADESRMQSAVALLELLLRGAARYKMASGLHIESVQADYETLKRKHAALEESEARFKTLSEQLEVRVQEQVRALEESSRQLYQAEKMASVGRLAAGVAHEINNPIGFVRSNLSTAQAYLEKFASLDEAISSGQPLAQRWKELNMGFVLEDFDDLLKESISGIDRVARIVADLKGFSNVDRGEEEMADLNESLRQACQAIAGHLPQGVEVVQELGDIPRVLCLPGYLNQAFLNLLENALQAVSAGGEIKVKTVREGDEIVIAISDNGCGIPEDVLQQVFEPFFTTKDVGLGTGLGLTVVRDIVRVHGGKVSIESLPDAGTTVTIRLPV